MARLAIIHEERDTIPKGEEGHQRNLTYSVGTAEAHLVIGNFKRGGKRICSVIYIVNRKEGNGYASKLMKYVEGYARQCRCVEMWYPTVLNPKLIQMLLKRGFKLQYHKDELFGEVDVFVKVLKK